MRLHGCVAVVTTAGIAQAKKQKALERKQQKAAVAAARAAELKEQEMEKARRVSPTPTSQFLIVSATRRLVNPS